MSKKSKALATYAERIGPEKKKAQKIHVESFVRDVTAGKVCFKNALELRAKMNAAGIKGLNHWWKAGRTWMRASDKNQYDLYFYDFALETLLKPAEREHMTKEVVRVCLHLANILEQPIKTVEQGAPLMQKCFVALGWDENGRRLIEHEHPPRNVFSEMEGRAAESMMLLRELKSKVPVETFDKTQAETFLKIWTPIYDEIGKDIKTCKTRV